MKDGLETRHECHNFGLITLETSVKKFFAVRGDLSELLEVGLADLIPKIGVKLMDGLIDDLFKLLLSRFLGEGMKLINLLFSCSTNQSLKLTLKLAFV